MASLLNQKLDIFPDSLRNIAAERVGGSNKIGMTALHELGLFSDIVADRHGTALDTLAPYLSKVCLQSIIQWYSGAMLDFRPIFLFRFSHSKRMSVISWSLITTLESDFKVS